MDVSMDRTTSPHLEASNEGWGRWENHVILELQRLDNNTEALRQKVEDMKADIREVKIRSYLYGGGAGGIVVIVGEIFLWWVTSH
jgi:hypothetical protein